MPDQTRSPLSPRPCDAPLAAALAYDVVVIGASAGGIAALHDLLSRLSADFPLPVLLAQHLSATLPSKLPEVLGYRTGLRTKWAEDGEALRPGTVFVAPPDRHLLVGPERRLALSSAERVGWWRPAVDVLFRSAADAFGDRTIAVVLSGAMWDGARGMRAVAEAGGITIAQDEASAGHFDMPAAALDLGRADLAMAPGKIAQALQVLIG
ncbi:chemotaxis protein CheB [Rubellimicrobium arenae]|uniref:chemotaxis protein CheB n=1 Tax=Rubellimicrobium arenae TaxID=2817372 RepID=UPI001B314290|nr:chemotaxis protein CheB [Rubellimicrobium arenae]